MKRTQATLDGTEAVALVAHKLNEVIAIYPITPSSPMGEFADEWSAKGKPNLWDTVPSVPFKDYALSENRYRLLMQSDPKTATALFAGAQEAIYHRWQRYERLAERS